MDVSAIPNNENPSSFNFNNNTSSLTTEQQQQKHTGGLMTDNSNNNNENNQQQQQKMNIQMNDPELISKLEEAKKELAMNLAKKKKLDKELAALETALYTHETAYLTDPSANSFGNIVKGYEAYVKAPPSTNISGDYHSTRRKRTSYPVNYSLSGGAGHSPAVQTELVGDAERIFSKSSGSYTRALEARSREHESNVTSEQESVVPSLQQTDQRKKSR